MTREEEQLLLIDLCARLSSLVRVRVDDEYMDGIYVLKGYESGWFVVEGKHYDIDEVTPYLRPMSSMTEEEKEEYDDLLMSVNDGCENTDYLPYNCMKYLDWLNSHGFDYRGLIPKGLALEAPKDMYKF